VPLLGTALGPSAIDWRTKEIVIVRTSALAGCRYCVAAPPVVALDAGRSRRQVDALRADRPAAQAFDSPREVGLLGWIEKVAGGGPIDDASRAVMRRQWADHEIVELTMVIGVTLMLNRFATALAADAEEAVPQLPGSDCNQLAGLVTRVIRDQVMAQVEIQAGPHRIVSLMSAEAVDEMGLEPGVLAVATVRSTSVVVTLPQPPRNVPNRMNQSKRSKNI